MTDVEAVVTDGQIQRSTLPENVETIRSLLQPASAEMIGSALFVFCACGSGVSGSYSGFEGSKTIGIGLAFGMNIFVLCYAIGHISGGHLNCAVTFTFCLMRRISIMRALFYFFAQFVGGLIGIGFLMLITPPEWQKKIVLLTMPLIFHVLQLDMPLWSSLS